MEYKLQQEREREREREREKAQSSTKCFIFLKCSHKTPFLPYPINGNSRHHQKQSIMCNGT
jgi:hypothetical protein